MARSGRSKELLLRVSLSLESGPVPGILALDAIVAVVLAVAPPARGQEAVTVSVPRVDGRPLVPKEFTSNPTPTASLSAAFVLLRGGEVLGAHTGWNAAVLLTPGGGPGPAVDVRLSLPFEFLLMPHATSSQVEGIYQACLSAEGRWLAV
jgi:hypothetical protein